MRINILMNALSLTITLIFTVNLKMLLLVLNCSLNMEPILSQRVQLHQNVCRFLKMKSIQVIVFRSVEKEFEFYFGLRERNL